MGRGRETNEAKERSYRVRLDRGRQSGALGGHEERRDGQGGKERNVAEFFDIFGRRVNFVQEFQPFRASSTLGLFLPSLENPVVLSVSVRVELSVLHKDIRKNIRADVI